MYMSLKKKRPVQCSAYAYTVQGTSLVILDPASNGRHTGCIIHTLLSDRRNVVVRLPFSFTSYTAGAGLGTFTNLTVMRPDGSSVLARTHEGELKPAAPFVAHTLDVRSFFHLMVALPIELALEHGSPCQKTFKLGKTHETLLIQIATL